MRNCSLYIFIICLMPCIRASGQDQKKITGNFQGYSFSRMAKEVEQQTHYHFYYDPTETDSLQLNINADQLTLSQLLGRIFKDTDFHFALDANGNVFISRRFSIQTSLPEHFFDSEKPF